MLNRVRHLSKFNDCLIKLAKFLYRSEYVHCLDHWSYPLLLSIWMRLIPSSLILFRLILHSVRRMYTSLAVLARDLNWARLLHPLFALLTFFLIWARLLKAAFDSLSLNYSVTRPNQNYEPFDFGPNYFRNEAPIDSVDPRQNYFSSAGLYFKI